MKIAENNYEIKKDLIQEAKKRFHKYQKSYQDVQNKKFTLDLSLTSLNNAKAKLDAGIGTKFEVLEAEAQLSRDKQSLNEKKIEHEINKISLQEILNINSDFDINNDQNLTGFWNHKLNKNISEGLNKNLSLKTYFFRNLSKTTKHRVFCCRTGQIFISAIHSQVHFPEATLSTNIDSEKSGSNYTNTISLNFGWNIFNGGQNKTLINQKLQMQNLRDMLIKI